MKNIRRQIPVRRYRHLFTAESMQRELWFTHGIKSTIRKVNGGFEVSPKFTTKDGKTKVVRVRED